MSNGNGTKASPWITLITLVLSKEGLVGALLTVMIASQVYDNYRSTSAQTELNASINQRMAYQTEHEKKIQDMFKDLIDAIEDQNK